jgi:hypothetical protein
MNTRDDIDWDSVTDERTRTLLEAALAMPSDYFKPEEWYKPESLNLVSAFRAFLKPRKEYLLPEWEEFIVGKKTSDNNFALACGEWIDSNDYNAIREATAREVAQ